RRRATEYFAALRTIWNPPGFRRGSVETGKAESSYRAGGVGAPAAAGRGGRRAAFGRGRSRAVRAGAFASAPARDRGGLLHRRVLLAAGAGAGRLFPAGAPRFHGRDVAGGRGGPLHGPGA